MANQQTRQNHPRGISFLNDGLTWHEGKGGKEPTAVNFEVAKGRCVNSSAERRASGRKPWKPANN